MPTDLLARLEEWKTRFGAPDTKKLHRLLAGIARHRFRDAESLIRLHECLLFLRAYPADAEVARLADAILFSFAERVAGMADLAPFEEAEVRGSRARRSRRCSATRWRGNWRHVIRGGSRSIGRIMSIRTSWGRCCGGSCRWWKRIGRWRRTCRFARGWMQRGGAGRVRWAGCWSGLAAAWERARPGGFV